MATLAGSDHPGSGLLIWSDGTFHGNILDLNGSRAAYVALEQAIRHIRFLLVRVFSGLPPCEG